MSAKRVTAPTVEPVTIADLVDHLRLPSGSQEHAQLQRWAVSARELVELYAGRALITQTWELALDVWPASGVVTLPMPPLISVSSITTYSDAQVGTVLSPSAYYVDTWAEPARLTLATGSGLPAGLRSLAGIVIRYQCGYGTNAADVPAGLRDAILAAVAYRWRYRGDDDPRLGGTETLPPQVEQALAPYRVMWVA